MAITFTSLTKDSTNNVSSVTTASISPTNTRMVYVRVINDTYAFDTPAIPTITGLSQTWTMLDTKLFWIGGRSTVFYAKMSTPGSGTLAIDFGGQVQNYGVAYEVVQGSSDIDNSGTNGVNSVVQVDGNYGVSSLASIGLNSFNDPNNAVLVFGVSWNYGTQTLDPLATLFNVTELTDGAAESVSSGYGTGETAPTIEFPTNTVWQIHALEILTGSPGSPPTGANGDFPEVVTIATYSAGAATNHSVTMPASIVAGNLLLALYWAGANVTVSASGWSTVGTPTNTGGTVRKVGILAKAASGSEGATQTFTCSSSAALDVITYQIGPWYGTVATGVAAGVSGPTTSNAPDSPSLSPSWGSMKNLWFSYIGVSGSIGINSTPSSYTDQQNTGNIVNFSVQRNNETGTENPGAWELSSGVLSWVAFTIAVRPEVIPVTPFISTVSSPLVDGTAGYTVTGFDFNSSKGTGKLWIGDRADFESAILEEQTTTAWGDTSITFTFSKGAIPYGTRYAFVEHDNDNVSPGKATLIPEPDPEEVDPPSAVGDTWVVLYGSPPVGGITDIIECSITDGVEQIGTCTFSIPRNAEGIDTATIGSEFGFWRSGEGEIFRGFINTKTLVIDRDSSKLYRFDCFDLGYELQKINTWRGFRWEQVAVQDVLDDIISLASGWTIEAIGDFIPITKSIDNMNLIEAIKEIAGIANAFWRISPSTRNIQFRSSPGETGLVFSNVEQATNDSRISTIGSFDSYKEDGSTIVNRIVPESKSDGDDIITLRLSTRNDPYEIKSLFRVPPTLTDWKYIFGETDDDDQLFSGNAINCLGENRWYGLYIVQMPSDKNIRSLSAGGRPLTNSLTGTGFTDGADTYRSGFYYAYNPSKGEVGISLNVADPSIPVDFWGAALGWKDSHVFYPVFVNHVGDQAGKASTASLTNPASIATSDQDLVISILVKFDQLDATPTGTNQVLLDAFDLGDAKVWVSTQPGDNDGQTTSSWSWTGTIVYFTYQIIIKPALVYYVEDATSIASYGVHEMYLPMGTFVKLSYQSITDIGNAMYDFIVDYLNKNKDPQKFYDFTCPWVTRGPNDWICGDNAQVIYVDDDDAINTDLIPVQRTQDFTRDGTRSWKITFSDRIQFKMDEAGTWLLEQLKYRVAAIQINQT